MEWSGVVVSAHFAQQGEARHGWAVLVMAVAVDLCAVSGLNWKETVSASTCLDRR